VAVKMKSAKFKCFDRSLNEIDRVVWAVLLADRRDETSH